MESANSRAEHSSQDQQESQSLNPDPYVGTPESDVFSWVGQQSYSDNCQIRVEEYILEMYTGLPIDEEGLMQEATENGWYTPGAGTPPEYSGNLLELHGIPTATYEDATTYDLANELAQGKKVIVGVDANELWDKAQEGEKPEDITDNHAVVVTGIDTTDPNDVRVLVSDPGTGEAAASYPMDQFVAAWQDSNFSITATQEPAPSSLPEMANFDYEAGYISEVMGMPYEEFANLDPSSEEWTSAIESTSGGTLTPTGIDAMEASPDETEESIDSVDDESPYETDDGDDSELLPGDSILP